MSEFFNKIQDAEVYLEDKTLLGRVKEVDLGNAEYESHTHAPMGAVGEFETAGKLKALSGNISFESLYPAIFKTLHPRKIHLLQLHSVIEGWDGDGQETEQTLITHVKVRFKNMSLGKFSQKEVTEFASDISISAVKQVVDGETIREIDIFNNIDNINGVPANRKPQ